MDKGDDPYPYILDKLTDQIGVDVLDITGYDIIEE